MLGTHISSRKIQIYETLMKIFGTERFAVCSNQKKDREKGDFPGIDIERKKCEKAEKSRAKHTKYQLQQSLREEGHEKNDEP
jgi:hypothetical protein